MTRSEFLFLLRRATTASVAFARRYVENDLPEAVRFHVLLNQSHDGSATAERVYPEDDDRELFDLSEKEVVDVLLRDGRCPEWIDVCVEAQSATDTRVRLLCCGRFAEDAHRMYYVDDGTGPFGIKSPDLPMGFKEGVRFRVPTV